MEMETTVPDKEINSQAAEGSVAGPPMFSYHAELKLVKDEFRLLRLLLSGPNDTIQCELFDANIYIARSYVWAPAEPSEQIIVNGHVFKVRANLYSILLSLRAMIENGEYLLLSIDAICIDHIHQ
jgi:hypothetical protein